MLRRVAQLGWFIDGKAGQEHRRTARDPEPSEGQCARNPHVEWTVVQELLEQMPRSVLTNIERERPPGRPSALAHVTPRSLASRTHLPSAALVSCDSRGRTKCPSAFA